MSNFLYKAATVKHTSTFTTWVFYSSLFALFCFPLFAKSSHVSAQNLPSLTHFPNQRTVLSCPSLQMPVTAQSPMVCEHKVVCPTPFLSHWMDPSTQCSKVTVTVTHDGLSVSWPSVWRCVYLYYSSLQYCFSVFLSVSGDVSLISWWTREHLFFLDFLIPLSSCVSVSNTLPLSQANNLTEPWRTIRTKVKAQHVCESLVWMWGEPSSSASAVLKTMCMLYRSVCVCVRFS